MKHIVSLSSGLSSAIVGERVIKKYGKENAEFVFMDTLVEDDDNYRFMHEYIKIMGVDLVILCDGRTPFQVLEDAKMIGSQYAAKCTEYLKIKPFREYLSTIGDDAVVHIGYDYKEIHRCKSTTENYNKIGYSVDYPLLWKPYELRNYSQVSRDDWGIEPPRMYAMGYSHANCGGRCVKMGQGDWKRTLINFPERYAETEAWENHMLNNVVAKKFTILRDQSNKKVTPLSLAEFREKNTELPDILDRDSACVHCGIGSLQD